MVGNLEKIFFSISHADEDFSVLPEKKNGAETNSAYEAIFNGK